MPPASRQNTAPATITTGAQIVFTTRAIDEQRDGHPRQRDVEVRGRSPRTGRPGSRRRRRKGPVADADREDRISQAQPQPALELGADADILGKPAQDVAQPPDRSPAITRPRR